MLLKLFKTVDFGTVSTQISFHWDDISESPLSNTYICMLVNCSDKFAMSQSYDFTTEFTIASVVVARAFFKVGRKKIFLFSKRAWLPVAL
jgi:hypothetical protein